MIFSELAFPLLCTKTKTEHGNANWPRRRSALVANFKVDGVENESDFEDDDFVGDALKMFVKWHYKSHNDFADFINMQGNFLMVEAEQELSAAIEEMKERTVPQVESAPPPPKATTTTSRRSLVRQRKNQR